MEHHTTQRPLPQPVAGLLEDEGRSKSWLARRIGYSIAYTNQVLLGHRDPGPEFRKKVSEVLCRDEAELFRAVNGPMAEVA
jgi:hypothetical protein